MSVSDVAALINIRGRVPSLASAEPSAAFVRWMLRFATLLIFLTATVIGVQFATAAPTEPPISISGPHR